MPTTIVFAAYDNSGNHQADIGASGAGDNQLDNPHGVVLATREEKQLYIADRDNNRVQIAQLDGTFAGRLTTGGGTAFDHPEDVAVDADGNLYVADTGNKRIVQFDSADNYVKEIMLQQVGFSFDEPCGLFVDNEIDGNYLLVTDRGTHTVYRIDTDGKLLAFWDARNLLRMRTLDRTKESKKGVVTYHGGLKLDPITKLYGDQVFVVKASGTLRLTPDDGSAVVNTVLNVGDLAFVASGRKAEKNDVLSAIIDQTEYYPELARLLKFDAPSRAVIDKTGLLVIADTDHHRVRVVRTQTNLDVNLLELGERLPDISYRVNNDPDWTTDLGLRVKVRKVPKDGALQILTGNRAVPVSLVSNGFKAKALDDFSDDVLALRQQFDHESLSSGAINALLVL